MAVGALAADTLAGYPANRAALVGHSTRSQAVATELVARLTVPFLHLEGTGASFPAPTSLGASGTRQRFDLRFLRASLRISISVEEPDSHRMDHGGDRSGPQRLA